MPIPYETTLGRTRGDYRSDNSRLKEVARAAARIVDLYSYTDDGRRVFNLEPLAGLGNTFTVQSLDLMHQWRNLYESLIAAGLIEPDHVGLPLDAGLAVFLRVQSKAPDATGWVNRSQFEVLTGAGSYAMADTAALTVFYDEATLQHVRVVRDVMPNAMRAQYLQGILENVTSTAIGSIDAGTTPTPPNGWFAISDESGVPDGEQDGSQFWPARLVIDRVFVTTGGGPVDNDTTLGQYKIAQYGSIRHGYDASGVFVTNVLRTVDTAAVLENVTKADAKTTFAAWCDVQTSGLEHFVLVRMSDYQAVQWFRGNTLQPVEVGASIVGDCFVLGVAGSSDGLGFITYRNKVDVRYVSRLMQALWTNSNESMEFVVKQVGQADTFLTARNYYQIQDVTDNQSASNDYGRYPVTTASDSYFYETEAAAQAVIDAQPVPASFVVRFRSTGFYPTPDGLNAENLTGIGTAAGTIGDGVVSGPSPTPTPTPTPAPFDGYTYGIFQHGYIYKGDVDETASFVGNIRQSVWRGYAATESEALDAIAQYAGIFATARLFLVRLSDLIVIKRATGGVVIDALTDETAGANYVSVENVSYIVQAPEITPLMLHYMARAGYGDNGDESRNWTVKPAGGAGLLVTTRNYYQYRNKDTGVSFPADLAADAEFFETHQQAIDAVLLIDPHGLDVGGYGPDPVTGDYVYIQGGAYEVRARPATFVAEVI